MINRARHGHADYKGDEARNESIEPRARRGMDGRPT
jgi:hypothetical protein